jgi:hypothetical protein
MTTTSNSLGSATVWLMLHLLLACFARVGNDATMRCTGAVRGGGGHPIYLLDNDGLRLEPYRQEIDLR